MGLDETTEGVLSRMSGYHHPSRPITAVVVKVAAVGYGPLPDAPRDGCVAWCTRLMRLALPAALMLIGGDKGTAELCPAPPYLLQNPPDDFGERDQTFFR